LAGRREVVEREDAAERGDEREGVAERPVHAWIVVA
jgi:hypothetical protein